MNLIYKFPSVKYSVDSIMEFQGGDETSFWSEPLFKAYPKIDKSLFKRLDYKHRENYLNEFFYRFYLDNKKDITNKVNSYNRIWKKHRAQITQALEDVFEIKLGNKFNNMVGNITFNPIGPRYLDTNSFDVFYTNDAKHALGLSLHEIIHFVWFYVWHEHFDDRYEEYESPSLKWILSEMVVETIMCDKRLKSINPYFDNGGVVYWYFYTLKIDNKLILDILYDMYNRMPITKFMEQSYQLCLKYETDIRRHIVKSEG